MKIKSAVFETSAPTRASCPNWALPEFAFIGRSNVGKSSLINLLAERNALAKASVTPGKTKLINLFRFNSSWCLVDLPGYGYAKVARTERADFNKAVADYIEKRDNLRHLFVLIDSRLEPQDIDLQFVNWLTGVGVAFSLVFTKADKQSAAATAATVAAFKKASAEFLPNFPAVFATSVTKKTGRMEILGAIEKELARVKGV